MEDLQKDFFEMLEAVAYEVEQFFIGITELVDEVAENVQSVIGTDIDQCLQEIFEPLAEIYLDFEEIVNETDQSFTYIVDTVEPTPHKHPACIGCRNYHGQVYSGNLLVCGMHPYGWEDKNCPDWESFGKDSTSRDIFWVFSY